MSIQGNIDSVILNAAKAKTVRGVADIVADQKETTIDDIIKSSHPLNIKTGEEVGIENIPKNGKLLENINGQEYETTIKTDENGNVIMTSEPIEAMKKANKKAQEKVDVKKLQNKQFINRLKNMTTWKPFGGKGDK